MCSGSSRHVLSGAVDRQVQPQSPRRAPKVRRKSSETRPERASRGLSTVPERAQDPTRARTGSRELSQASPRFSGRQVRPPKTAQDSPRSPKTGPKIPPKGPKTESRRQSEGPKERLRSKKQKSAPRLSGSVIFEGREGPNEAPNQSDFGAKSAQEASRTEDSTRRVGFLAGWPEIRPRTADGRLEEGSGPTAP